MSTRSADERIAIPDDRSFERSNAGSRIYFGSADQSVRSGDYRGRSDPFLEAMSSREIEVLQLIADGLGNREIALALHVSEETVKTHVQRLLRKLRATGRAHAVALGLRHRLIA